VTVQLELNGDAALVLFEYLASHEKIGAALDLDAPERHAFELLEAALQRTLVEPFSQNYSELLAKARQALVEQYGS
jgi:hypothetical protein